VFFFFFFWSNQNRVVFSVFVSANKKWICLIPAQFVYETFWRAVFAKLILTELFYVEIVQSFCLVDEDGH